MANFCPQCGNRLSQSSKFCDNCGVQIVRFAQPEENQTKDNRIKIAFIIYLIILVVVVTISGIIVFKKLSTQTAVYKFRSLTTSEEVSETEGLLINLYVKDSVLEIMPDGTAILYLPATGDIIVVDDAEKNQYGIILSAENNSVCVYADGRIYYFDRVSGKDAALYQKTIETALNASKTGG